MILGEIFLRNERCFPNHPAVEFEGRSVTHGELARRIRRLANALTARGLVRGDRIGVLSRNCVEYLEIYGAAALTGFVCMGINYRLAAAEQADILLDGEPAVLVFEDFYTERVDEVRRRLPANQIYVAIGKAPDWALNYETLMSEGADMMPRQMAAGDDTFMFVYTSGTTGKPKGAMLGNAAQLEQAREQGLMLSAQQTDRKLIVMPFYHIGGPTHVFTYLMVGATIVLHRAFEAQAILRSFSEFQVTVTHLAPTMIEMLLEALDKAPCDVSSLHTICYASSPMSVALSRRARKAFGPIFVQIYGLTECGLGSILLKHQHVVDGPPQAVKRLASAGQPYLTSRMRIVRPDGVECAIGEVGDVCIRSPAVMQGYWRRPEATAAALVGGELRTGDMGYFDDEGFLFIVDRKKDMIISGGENIYSREVEEALLLHPAIVECAVIGVPDPRWGESVMAVVVVRDDGAMTLEQIQEHCVSMIASYKKPRYLSVVDALPRVASTNKIDKKALREPHWRTHQAESA